MRVCELFYDTLVELTNDAVKESHIVSKAGRAALKSRTSPLDASPRPLRRAPPRAPSTGSARTPGSPGRSPLTKVSILIMRAQNT